MGPKREAHSWKGNSCSHHPLSPSKFPPALSACHTFSTLYSLSLPFPPVPHPHFPNASVSSYSVLHNSSASLSGLGLSIQPALSTVNASSHSLFPLSCPHLFPSLKLSPSLCLSHWAFFSSPLSLSQI